MLLFILTSTVSTLYIDYHMQELVNCPGQRKSDTSVASVVKYSTYPKTPYMVSTIITLLDVHLEMQESLEVARWSWHKLCCTVTLRTIGSGYEAKFGDEVRLVLFNA